LGNTVKNKLIRVHFKNYRFYPVGEPALYLSSLWIWLTGDNPKTVTVTKPAEAIFDTCLYI
jgi:hypothetical protein